MNIEIRYLSRTGNTKKIADTIGEELRITASPITVPLLNEVDVLFLGSAIYGFDIDPKMKEYISDLDTSVVKKVVLFSTSYFMKSVNKKMRKLLEKRGIEVLEHEFYTKGGYKKMNVDLPNSEDLENARKFSKEVMEEIND